MFLRFTPVAMIRSLRDRKTVADGNRTVFFELNGQPREVDVRDKSLEATTVQRAKADPAKEGEIGAPLPGGQAGQWLGLPSVIPVSTGLFAAGLPPFA